MAERMTFFRSYYEAIEELDDSIQLEVLRAIIRFGLYGEEPEGLSPFAKMAFTFARPSLEKSANKGDASRTNGNKGGRPRKPTETQENLTEPTETQENLTKPVDYRHKAIDIDNKTVDVETIDKDLETKTLEGEKRVEAKASKREILDALVAKWNSYADRGSIPTVRSVSVDSKTGKSVLARVNEHGLDEAVEMMDTVFRSNYLRGFKNGWCAKFDWVFLPTNYEKIMNGNYNDADVVKTQNSMIDQWVAEESASGW